MFGRTKIICHYCPNEAWKQLTITREYSNNGIKGKIQDYIHICYDCYKKYAMMDTPEEKERLR